MTDQASQLAVPVRGEQTDVFISYSRKDSQFVHRLFTALAKTGRSAWVDWEGIPLTADWWQEIQSGIEKANTFIFVISPSSLESPICQLELAHALHNHKRLLPVVVASPDEKAAFSALATRDLDDNTRGRLAGHDILLIAKSNWQEIARHNWVQFDGEHTFEERLQGLVTAIETDLDYVREHTRLLIRAREWDNKAHNRAFFLHGIDLSVAENWLARAAEKEPKPTKVHMAYIFASRAAERRNQRNLLTGVGLALVVAVSLAILALWQARIAQVNEQSAVNNALTATIAQGRAVFNGQTAVANANRSESQRLAAAMNNLLQAPTSDPRLAVLLGIRALKTAFSAQADAALQQALDWNEKLHVLHDQREVESVTYSPNGKLVLTHEHGGTLNLWEVATSQLLHSFGYASGVAFSPDSEMLLVSSRDGTASLWDIQSKQTLRTLNTLKNSNLSVAFSPDGKLILTGDGAGTTQLWDVASGGLLRSFSYTAPVLSVTFSPDGKMALTGNSDGTALVWEVANGQVLHTLTSQMDQVYQISSLTFSPDGTTLLAGDNFDHFDLWTVTTGKRLHSFDHIDCAVFSPDGRMVLTGSNFDGTVQLWDIASRQVLRTLSGHTNKIWSMAFSPDGKTVVTGSSDTTARLWDVSSGQVLRTLSGHTAQVLSVAFSPDGKTVLTGSTDTTARLWDVTNKTLSHTFTHTAQVMSVAFSPDGKTALTVSYDNVAQVWDVATGQTLRVLANAANRAVFSPDGKLILTASVDGTTGRLWDVASGQVLRTLTDHTEQNLNQVVSLAFSPDGKTMLTGSIGGTAKLWDVTSGQVLRTLSGHTDGVWGVAFSPDGKTILTGSADKTANLWDTTTGQVLRTLSGHTDGIVSVAFSPDGTTILTGSADKTANLWDTTSGQLWRTLSGHTDTLSTVAFSPDGKMVLTGSLDHTVLLWDVANGQVLRTLSGHTDMVMGAAFSPDGKMILTGSADKTAKLWATDYRDFIAYACTRVWQDFTLSERRQFDLADNEPTCPQFANVTVDYAYGESGTPTPILNGSLTTPMPSSPTPLALTLPAWTPIASPTDSPTATYLDGLLTFTPAP